ncbi:MAG: Aspartate aminotransferase [uncultured Thermomicrobiales bacterium]|uniref:Aminotransferase n=1 Tax=uncultured Thermomicrobiales bacterium TaxID=1645740 RepID=A0A6J4USQ7_9BACT|nr:MAG: Aspartate aminotransferase [uncultured Thermomicrobiales bacterium]
MTDAMAGKLAARMGRLGTETAFEVLVRAKALEAQGRDVIHLEIGEPDFDTPAHVIEAGCDALRGGWTHYGPSAGQPDLRAAIAGYVNRSRGTDFAPEHVVVAPGGKPIMFFVILALVEAGDEAIYPDPGFPIYRSMIDFAGATAVPIPLREEREFRLDVDELAGLITPRTKLLIVNSPANPTGGVLERGDLEAIARLAVEHDLVVLADEIYSELLFEGEHVSLATFPGMAERTVILDGFSKTYAMTGWRLGYGLMPPPLVEAVNRLMVNSVSCTSVAVQRAGLAALTGAQDCVAEMREAFRRRRDLVVDGLNAIPGISCVRPKGAFYAFPNITGTGMASKAFADALLQEHGVATLAGTAFGDHGEGYLRLSTANSEANLSKALERIETMVRATAGPR